MPIQYGYNSPVIQPTYGYPVMPAQSFAQAPAPMWNGPYRDTSQSGYDPRYWR